jgi:ABC-type amino acid transport substrate-binding protein
VEQRRKSTSNSTRLLSPCGSPNPTTNSMLCSLQEEVDAVVDDSPIAKWFSRSVRGLQFAGVLPGTQAAYAIMVSKGNRGLQAEINRALDEIANDGTRRSLLLKWFDDGSTEVNG